MVILNSKEYRTKVVLEQFTEKQQGLIKTLNLIPLWESQVWLSWKEKYNNKIDDFNTHFQEYIDNQDLENNKDILILISKRNNIWGRRYRFVFISKQLDKKLSEGINKGYKYQNDLRLDLKDKDHYTKLMDYSKKYKIKKQDIADLNNEEIDYLCKAFDNFGNMGSEFVLHNVLEWK